MNRPVRIIVASFVLVAGCSDADPNLDTESADTSSTTEAEPTTTAPPAAPSSTSTSSTSTTSPPPTAPPSAAAVGPLETLRDAAAVDPSAYHQADFGGGLTGYEGIAFDSPSRNVTCQILSGASDGSAHPPPSVTCHIRERDSDPAPPAGGCGDVDWHPGLISLDPSGSVSDGTCAPDLGPLSANVLPYGHAVVGDGFGCVSEQAGVTCLVVDSERGFRIRRAGLDRY